jgi:hypothetical protein
VRCTKCETEFTVDAAALRASAAAESPEDFVPGKSRHEESEWSYRQSTLRYVVLGVLLVVMCVLGYKLYDKKMKERQEAAAEPEGRGIPPAELPTKMNMPLPPDPTPAGGAPKGGNAKDNAGKKGKGGPAPKAKGGPSVEEAKKILTGRWQGQHEGRDVTVEYKADGTFSYTAAQGGKADKPMTGKWTLASVELVGTPMGRLTILHTEWAVEGSPAIKDVIMLRSDKMIQHLHLDQEREGNKVRSELTKQS